MVVVGTRRLTAKGNDKEEKKIDENKSEFRDALVPGARSTVEFNFVWRRLTYIGPKYRTQRSGSYNLQNLCTAASFGER